MLGASPFSLDRFNALLALTILIYLCVRSSSDMPLPNSTLGRVGGGGTGRTVHTNHSGLAYLLVKKRKKEKENKENKEYPMKQ